MKNLCKILLPVVLMLLPGFSRADVFKPTSAPNPWADDYRSLSSMENYKSWGTYNVHDPACRKVGDYYYMYSTDAIFAEKRQEAAEKGVPMGFIQMRRSADLVNWEFLGWALPEIPAEAVQWVKLNAGGNGAENIWAPYMMPHGDKFRLYYCVSAFGKNTSYIGLAESSSPEGPWELKGCVVRTDESSVMNAIDPSVVVTDDGKWWMHYGSFFGGLYCVELNPATGLPVTAGDQGHLVARRADYSVHNLEAPEIIYHEPSRQYFLFGSYDPLMTTYNVRVGRSDKPEGPFIDFFGKEMSDTTNNFPILTAPYRFDSHDGWVGTAHCGVFTDGEGNYFMAHQGRLASESALMDLHVRRILFTPDGWPVVSPQRYAGVPQRSFSAADLEGEWEIVRIVEPRAERRLEAGQILWGEGALLDGEWNIAEPYTLANAGVIAENKGSWQFDEKNQLLSMTLNGEKINNLIIFAGHDWERRLDTVLFTGLDDQGRSVWGKRTK